MTEGSGPVDLSEQRLLILLDMLKRDEVQSDPHLTRLVIQTLRWQVMLRSILHAAESVLGSLEAAFLLLARRSNG